MSNPTINLFVSYSHADAVLVAPVVALLRINNSFVFQDITDIKPSKKWRGQIDDALNKADLVVVFWCDHANKSDLVKIEWSSAVLQEKDLLPLLLDDTPLPPELAQYQWIDFQKVVGANHKAIEPSDWFLQDRTEVRYVAYESPKTISLWQRFVIGSLVGLAALAIIIFALILSPPAEPVFAWVLGLLGALAVSVISITVWRRQKLVRRQKAAKSAEPLPSFSASPPYPARRRAAVARSEDESAYEESANRYAPKSIEQEIAGAVEREILRRHAQ